MAERTGSVGPATERHWSEGVARRWLERRGFVFVAGNVVVPGGELDLVMRDGGTLVFVEVRHRRDDRFGGATASLTGRKLRRVWRAARRFALRRYRGRLPPMRIDAVLLAGPAARPAVTHLRDVARDLAAPGEAWS